jgi:hypothetical protein
MQAYNVERSWGSNILYETDSEIAVLLSAQVGRALFPTNIFYRSPLYSIILEP